MSCNLISIKNVSKIYRPDNHALKDITLDIYRGEIISLLGVNGAGKTTLSSIIATLCPLSRGQVLWQGRSIYKDLLSYRRILGFCPQSQNLDASLSLEQNLIFAGRYFDFSNQEISDRKDMLIEQFELGSFAKSNVSVLSGGYRQRFLIARTMMHSPQLIILDEPTVGLDPNMRRILWKYIAFLRDEGITVLLTTHYLDEAEFLSDRVCLIDDGVVRTIDTPENLKNTCEKNNLEEAFLSLIND